MGLCGLIWGAAAVTGCSLIDLPSQCPCAAGYDCVDDRCVCTSESCNQAECADGFAECDANIAGCETELDTSAAHCGACGNSCDAGPNAESTCIESSCELSCNEGYADCSKELVGCEAALDTDPANCGGCGISCGQGACAAGACQPIAVGKTKHNEFGTPLSLAVHDNTLFWSTYNSHLFSANTEALDGTVGGDGVSYDTIDVFAFSMLIAGNKLIWADPANSLVSSLDLNSPVVTVTNEPGNEQLGAVAVMVAGDTLYWANNCFDSNPADEVAPNCWPSAIWRMTLGDQNSVELVVGEGATHADGCAGPGALAIVGDYLYWTEPQLGQIRRTRIDQDQQLPNDVVDKWLDTDLFLPFQMFERNGMLVWTNTLLGYESTCRQQIATKNVDCVQNTGTPNGLAVDEDSVYWTAGNKVYRLRVNDAWTNDLADAFELAKNQPDAGSLAVTDSSVYWVNRGPDPDGYNQVMRLEKTW